MDRMLADLTPRQLVEWQAYLDECGEADDWLQFGVQTAAIVNEIRQNLAAVGGAQLRQDQLAKPSDYIPSVAKAAPKKRQSSTEIMRALGPA